MRVLGIDCGSERTGFGVIDSDGRTHRLVRAGVIRTSAANDLGTRLLRIAEGLRRVICETRPDRASVESVFTASNARSAMVLCHVRGVALLSLTEAGVAVTEFSPSEIKASVTGHGRSDKQQVQHMVHSLLKLSRAPQPEVTSLDACDALAAAICCASRATPAQVTGAAR